MRRLPMLIAAVLVMTACGGASESSVETSASPAGSVPMSAEAAEADVEATADALIAAMGDERTALAAVLLAADSGYNLDQIVSGGVEGRLHPGGSISSADGAPVVPDFEPSGILDDDVTGDASEPVGFRSLPDRIPLTAFMNQFNQLVGGQRGSLMTVLILFELGYSLEQIVTAVLADGLVNRRHCLVDENGNVIEPHRSATQLWQRVDGAWCEGASTPTSTVAVAETEPGATAPAGTEPPDEPEGGASIEEGRLSGTWDLWWENSLGDSSVAFVIRFIGVESGTLEVLNDNTEYDTFFELSDDVVTLGFTRITSPGDSDLRPDFFIGTFADENTIYGEWRRPGSECAGGECAPVIIEYDIILRKVEP